MVRTAPAASPAKPASAVDQHEVARVAYELFQRRGGSHGKHVEDWIEAERIVRKRRFNGNGNRK